MLLFKVATRIGRTVAELERNLEYSELLEWAEFFEYELNTFEKRDYYDAQIACVIAQAHTTTKGKKFKIKDFLVKFKTGNAKKLSPFELAKCVCSWVGLSIGGE